MIEAELSKDETRPQYYREGGIECREVIKAWNLNFNLGNVLKYISRCEHKGNKEQDLKKAMQYIQFELEDMEKSC